jgi:hypothetical protein
MATSFAARAIALYGSTLSPPSIFSRSHPSFFCSSTLAAASCGVPTLPALKAGPAKYKLGAMVAAVERIQPPFLGVETRPERPWVHGDADRAVQ